MDDAPEDVSHRDLPDVQWFVLSLLAQDLDRIGTDRLYMSPVGLAATLQFKSLHHMSSSCKELLELGLVEKHPDHVLYRISDDGRAFVNGTMSLEEIEEKNADEDQQTDTADET